ncbi:MAG: hypothetical protein GXX96_11310 [Planctomycetaceae bacterium]|nr:hypothetical protein [Planctomycetaceae bacterium]
MVSVAHVLQVMELATALQPHITLAAQELPKEAQLAEVIPETTPVLKS